MSMVQLLLTMIFFQFHQQNDGLNESGIKPSPQQITISFSNTINRRPVNFDSTYVNAFDERFTVRSLKYYISQIVLTDSINGKTQKIEDRYFLINEADDLSKDIVLSTTIKDVSSISFVVGVDSLKNVSGVQTGVLDPAKGMFWTWNTGYVFFKFEGNSPAAKTPGRSFSYHVGGYKSGEDAARKIELKLAKPAKADSNIRIDVSVEKIFYAMNAIKISTTPLCHEPGELAMKLADNYQHIFSITVPPQNRNTK